MADYKFTVIVQKDEDGNFLAICPALRGCYANGDTIEKALEMIKPVIKMHIEDRLECGEPIPEEVYSAQLEITM